MWSRYLRTKEKDGVVAIFHELHPDPLFCSSLEWRGVANGLIEGTDEFIHGLRQRKLLINALEDDDRDFRETASNFERKLNQPTILYLMTAQGCNFHCKYCPVPEIAQKHGETLLSTEDAFAGIDLWEEHLADVYEPDVQYFVIFYGGEPLLNKRVIKDSLGYLRTKREARRLPDDLNLMVATNGVLIDEEFIALCKEYGVMVAVGLDGPKPLNDALKVDCDGIGTFDRIIPVIEQLVQSGVRTFASVSITPANLDHIQEYSRFFSELGVEKFGFNFLKGRLLLELVGYDGLDDYYKRASRGVIESARQQAQPGFEYQMEKKQLAFDNKDFFPVNCTCYGNQLVIQPDGQISNCPFSKTWLGRVQEAGRDFRIWNQPIVREWRKSLPIHHSGEAKALNGGGCAWSSIELAGTPLAVDNSSRIFSEEVLDELIWSRYNKLYPK